MDEKILVQVDKTVVRVTGLTVFGLDTRAVESLLRDLLGTVVRVIGVTGDAVTMDVYGLDEEAVLRAAGGIITAVSLAEGITAGDLVQLDASAAVRTLSADAVPPERPGSCCKERWL